VLRTWDTYNEDVGCCLAVSEPPASEVNIGVVDWFSGNMSLLQVGGSSVAKGWPFYDDEPVQLSCMVRIGDNLHLVVDQGTDLLLLSIGVDWAVKGCWKLSNHNFPNVNYGGRAIAELPGGELLIGGYCSPPEGGCWSDVSCTLHDVPGTWADQAISPGIPVGIIGQPNAPVTDVTDGIHDTHGGGLVMVAGAPQ